MAERIILKARIAGVDFANVIESEADLDTIQESDWTAQPVTLRDDEISIVEGEPDESEVFSHENDAPEDYDVAGTGVTAVGSFIKATFAEMATLMGGEATTVGSKPAYLHSSAKKVIETAIRFRLKNGGAIIIPYAKGGVQFNANAGYDGVMKFPFRFRALAQKDWGVDLVVI